MSQAAKAQEPSMEEILASIRRIIADDDTTTKPAPPAAAAAPRPAAMPPRTPMPPSPPPRAAEPPPPPPLRVEERPPAPPEPEPEDILDLTEQMAEPEPPSFQTIDGQNDVIFADPHPEPQRMAEPPRAPAPPPPPAVDPTERPLLSSSTTSAVDSAFNTLAQTVLVQNARTLEDLVREMLRPLLKSWLDDNLPGMVERIVRAEIERVSRGRS
jgi:cell pole-organizing protein PopZ